MRHGIISLPLTIHLLTTLIKMSCISNKFLNSFAKMFGMKTKKAKLEEISDYADFYWQFMSNGAETDTTGAEDLPGFTDYHKMLKRFLASQPIYDEVCKEEESELYVQDSYVRVREWLEGVEGRRGEEKFSDVHNFLHDSQANCQHCVEEDTMHYACVDVTGMTANTAVTEVKTSNDQVNLSFESTGSLSSWEVTKKPRSRINSRASDWV